MEGCEIWEHMKKSSSPKVHFLNPKEDKCDFLLVIV